MMMIANIGLVLSALIKYIFQRLSLIINNYNYYSQSRCGHDVNKTYILYNVVNIVRYPTKVLLVNIPILNLARVCA